MTQIMQKTLIHTPTKYLFIGFLAKNGRIYGSIYRSNFGELYAEYITSGGGTSWVQNPPFLNDGNDAFFIE